MSRFDTAPGYSVTLGQASYHQNSRRTWASTTGCLQGGAPYHPMTQGKIERYPRAMKNVVKREHYYPPWGPERAIRQFVNYYNHERYHESLDNVTPADRYFGRDNEIMVRRAMIKQKTLHQRRTDNLRGYAGY